MVKENFVFILRAHHWSNSVTVEFDSYQHLTAIFHSLAWQNFQNNRMAANTSLYEIKDALGKR